MTVQTALKLGQIAGALIMAAGVTSCSLKAEAGTFGLFFIGGGALYGGCRIAAWLLRKD